MLQRIGQIIRRPPPIVGLPALLLDGGDDGGAQALDARVRAQDVVGDTLGRFLLLSGGYFVSVDYVGSVAYHRSIPSRIYPGIPNNHKAPKQCGRRIWDKFHQVFTRS